MKVVLLFNAPRLYYRPILVDRDELFCSPHVEARSEHAWRCPTGDYDVAAFLKTLPERWREPDLVVTHFDMLRNQVPRNLAGVKCPKVLIVGDTHHLKQPIRKPLIYALNEPYDWVVGEFNRHHLHFFLEARRGGAPVPQVGWIPCFTLNPHEEFAGSAVTRGATFVGQAGKWHPYRRRLLIDAKNALPELECLQGPPRDAAMVHAQSRISLNISLNGDFNLRVFEVLAAGGFLLTDRLAPESGLQECFTDGRHLVQFDDSADLVGKIRHYLANPAAAEAIAREGHAHYMAMHRPAHKVEALLELVRGGNPRFTLASDRRSLLPPATLAEVGARMAVYEFLLEIHCLAGEFRALFTPATWRHAVDAIDLPRLRATALSTGAPPADSPLHAAGLQARLAWRDVAVLPPAGERWDVVVCEGPDLDAPFLQQVLRDKLCHMIVLARVDTGRDSPLVQRQLAQHPGWSVCSQDPPVLACAPLLEPAPDPTKPWPRG